MLFIHSSLFLILLVVLFGPFLVKKIEEELEIFLFIAGCGAVTISGLWSGHLVHEALMEPVKITIAVFVAGILFELIRAPLKHNVNKCVTAIGLKLFSFIVIVSLGLLSSVITAIIAALVLVEIIACLNIDRKTEIKLVVLACFAIGLGAVLTPIGEPLSTIAISKLKGEPFNADFFFLFKNLGHYVVPGVILFGVLGVVLSPDKAHHERGLKAAEKETMRSILIRTGKVYLFVMALIFLGSGFKPIIDAYIIKLPYQGLYWINTVSAILDNATLTAAEISPAMGLVQIKAALLGLLIAGGMLIPGNIPNIISAGKLKIKSTEWAKAGVPIGFIVMLIYFFLLR